MIWAPAHKSLVGATEANPLAGWWKTTAKAKTMAPRSRRLAGGRFMRGDSTEGGRLGTILLSATSWSSAQNSGRRHGSLGFAILEIPDGRVETEAGCRA